jgi:lipid-A-disaccharide synthase
MRIFFSAGEPSGDLHGANLIRALQQLDPQFSAVGYGGPEMQSAGCDLHTDLTEHAVMGFARALGKLSTFWGLVGKADRYLRRNRPDAVVLIDYPGFNWWIARRAKAYNIPVFYYAPPQVWAWATWRVNKMRRLVDHVLCALPFEAKWFAERGCNATFVGHPYFDEVRRQTFDESFLQAQREKDGPLVAILPGSRTQEVETNLETFLHTARRIQAQVPSVRFAVASFKPHQAEFARRRIAAAGLPIEVHLGRTPELIHLAECCLAVSGSVSLELLYQAKPTVIHYRVSPLMYRLQAKLRHVQYITLVNLLTAKDIFPQHVTAYDPLSPAAADVLFPEYLTCTDRSAQMAEHIVGWLTNPGEKNRLVARLTELREQIGHGGAAKQAAAYISQILMPRSGIASPLLSKAA